jgi:ProP effector
METKEKFLNSKEVIAFLAETFPQCFTVEGEAKPLKVGIFQDVVERLQEEGRLSKTLLRSSLRHYTNSWRYLHAIKEGVHRIDLDGNQSVVIEKEHADHALKILTESKEKVAQQRKLKQQKAKKAGKTSDITPKVKPTGGERSGKKVKVPNSSSAAKSARTVPEKLTETTLVVGTSVTVKIGKAPMNAVITEVAKDGVHVQLNSGMTMKVPSANLRLASK